LVVGAPYATTNESGDGAAYVVYGPITGEMDLADAPVQIVGTTRNHHVGWETAYAGRVDDSGVDAILIGATGDDRNGTLAGAAVLVIDPSTGITTMGDHQAEFLGAHSYDIAGDALSSAGDVDGDGFDDLFFGVTATAGDAITPGGARLVLSGW
jgi:hypothetical protein